MINEMGAGVSGQKWCDNNNVSAGAKGFGWMPCLDSRKQLGTVGESAARAAICPQLWLLLSCFAWSGTSMTRIRTQWSSPSPTPLPSSPAMIPAVFFKFRTGFIYLSSSPDFSTPLSFLQSLIALSFCLPLSLSFSFSLFLLLIIVSRPPSTSIVEFRQAIYIFLPGCLTSHSLNKVCFIVFARLYTRTVCECVFVHASQQIGAYESFCRGFMSLFFLYFFFYFLMVSIWVCNRSFVSIQVSFFFYALDFDRVCVLCVCAWGGDLWSQAALAPSHWERRS